METTWDKLRAVLFALLVHAFAFALLFFGLHWQMPVEVPEAAEGPIIEATLVSTPQQTASAVKAIQQAQQRQEEAAPPPQPLPEPTPQHAQETPQVKPQQQLPVPDTVEQEEVRRNADLAAMREAAAEQERRLRQEQVDLTHPDQQQEQADRREHLSPQIELERQKKLAAINATLAANAKDIHRREEAARQLQDQATRIAQAGPVTQPQPRSGGGTSEDANLVAYKKALNQNANLNWHKADSVPPATHCKVLVTQIPGGEVLDVKFLDCPFSAEDRQGVTDSLTKAPMPYAGFEKVFQRQINLDLCYPEERCK